MGPIQLTNNFITESGELRLLIMVPEDSSGSIGVKVSNTTHRVERMPADGTAAAGGLLRIGDRVISVDGTLLGETKLLDAIQQAWSGAVGIRVPYGGAGRVSPPGSVALPVRRGRRHGSFHAPLAPRCTASSWQSRESARAAYSGEVLACAP